MLRWGRVVGGCRFVGRRAFVVRRAAAAAGCRASVADCMAFADCSLVAGCMAFASAPVLETAHMASAGCNLVVAGHMAVAEQYWPVDHKASAEKHPADDSADHTASAGWQPVGDSVDHMASAGKTPVCRMASAEKEVQRRSAGELDPGSATKLSLSWHLLRELRRSPS